MKNEHPLIKYGKAIAIIDNNLNSNSIITSKHLLHSLQRQIEYFRVKPSEIFTEKSKIKYQFDNNKCTDGLKKLPEHGIFMAPNVIAEDGSANQTWKQCLDIIKALESSKNNSFNALLSITAVAGDYIRFSDRGGSNKATQKLSKHEAALSMIALITPDKPCIYENGNNIAIIPDLQLDEMIDFIRFFKDMLSHKTSSELFIGRVKKELKGNKKNPTITYKPIRPLLFNGNFPNPPKSTVLGTIALLATIGEFAKEAKYSVKANKVLNSLRETTMYLIRYGDAQSYTYNNHIIELAKEGSLRQIVDSIYYTKLYNQPEHARWDYNNPDYQKFDLFTARFLQLFNKATFKDFLAFRAEYPYQLKILFKTYFIKMEKIDSRIVSSARQLGKWLNKVAYFTAKAEIKEGSQNYKEKLREQKAKVLIELESAAFSAKSGDALMAQVITRAGRLSMMDVPPEADLFIECAINGELTLEQSKNLIIAFSRLNNSSEKTGETDEVSTENSNANYENI